MPALSEVRAVLAVMESDPLDEPCENLLEFDDSGVGFIFALYNRLFSFRAPLRRCRAGVYPSIWAALAEWRFLTLPSRLSGRRP